MNENAWYCNICGLVERRVKELQRIGLEDSASAWEMHLESFKDFYKAHIEEEAR